MRAGRIDRIITIQRKSVTYSSSGEPQETWAVLVERWWASIAAVSGDERFTGEQWVAKEQTEFRIRWSTVVADLSPLDRIIYPAPASGDMFEPPTRSIYNVMSVQEIGRMEVLQILAARRADVPA
jgi:head-tail adaptor